METAASQENSQLHDYELVVIISPEVVEQAFDSTIDKVSRFITENGGVISNTEQWGKRKLAYPISHFIEGNYVLTRFKFRPELSKELEARLRISEEVIRHLLIRVGS